MTALKSLLPRLAAIKAQAAAATPGPWSYDALLCMANVTPEQAVMPDVEFIAAARTDVPALCEALEEAKALLERAFVIAHAPHAGWCKPEACVASLCMDLREALGQEPDHRG